MGRSRKTDAAHMPGPADHVLEGTLAFVSQLGAVDCKPRAVQFTIDGMVYTSTKLPATVGLAIWPRLAALLGAGLMRAVASGDVGAITGAALLDIADRAMQDGLVPLLRTLLDGMECSRLWSTEKPGRVLDDFDQHFAGEYGHLMKVAAFAVAHNLRGPTYGVR